MAPKRDKSTGKKAGGTARMHRRDARKTVTDTPEPKEPEKPKAPPPLPYDGPRPDEELIHNVQVESIMGDEANIEAIYEMVNKGEDVNQCKWKGRFTPLAVAAAAGNAPLVSILLECRADVTVASYHRSELPLHHAARHGRRVVCQLLAGPTAAAGLLDSPSCTGSPPLHLAAAGNHLDCVCVLLQNGAKSGARNMVQGGDTAVHLAASVANVVALETLLDHDAEPDLPNTAGRSPLHFAATCGDAPCVSLLLRSRADPLRRGYDGRLALDLVPSGKEGSQKVVTLLQAYERREPKVPRVDVRFDKRDEGDELLM